MKSKSQKTQVNAYDALYQNPRYSIRDIIPNTKYEIVLSGQTIFAPPGLPSTGGDGAIIDFNDFSVAYRFTSGSAVADSKQSSYYLNENSWGWLQPASQSGIIEGNLFKIYSIDGDSHSTINLENIPSSEEGVYDLNMKFILEFSNSVDFDKSNMTIIMHTDRKKTDPFSPNMFITTFIPE